MDALFDLSPQRQERLIAALSTGTLSPPYSASEIRLELGGFDDAESVEEALRSLDELGIRGEAAAAWIRIAAKQKSAVTRPELVWTGPEVQGLHARDTSEVFEEMQGRAQQSLWACTYAYYDGPSAFKVLAARMDERPDLQATLLLNIGRNRRGSQIDSRSADEIVSEFASRFWARDWPGQRRPRVFYYPKALSQDDRTRGVLHAKTLVCDEVDLFITSANFTEAALHRNIELGFKISDSTLARQVIRHYQRLIEEELLLQLPIP